MGEMHCYSLTLQTLFSLHGVRNMVRMSMRYPGKSTVMPKQAKERDGSQQAYPGKSTVDLKVPSEPVSAPSTEEYTLSFTLP